LAHLLQISLKLRCVAFTKTINLKLQEKKMSEFIRRNEEQKEYSLSMVLMALLMTIAALYGIWFLPVLIKMLTKIVS